MRRVLIVDDEVLVRIGIKHSITWDQNGFELIGFKGIPGIMYSYWRKQSSVYDAAL